MRGGSLRPSCSSEQGRTPVIAYHGLVKSLPGTPTEDVTSFLVQAEQTANEGAELARLVSKWHRSQMPKSCVDVDD